MKVINKQNIGKRKVYDISVADAEHYILKNGVVTHNTGPYYSADNIWILGRQQDKTDEGIQGYNFVINVEKSRFVKEKSKILVNVSYESGINRWSGLLEEAMDGGYIIKPKQGWYAVVDKKTGEVLGPNMRAADIVNNAEMWKMMLIDTDLAKFIQSKYALGENNLITNEENV